MYSKALGSFDPRDVRDAVTRMATRPRRDGETTFPDLGTVLIEVRAAREHRGRFATIESINAEARRREEYPEQYTSLKEIRESPEVKSIMGRHDRHKKQPAVTIESAQLCCPACDAVVPVMAGVRLLTSAELRQLADLREQQEIRAEQRRLEGRRVAAEIQARDSRTATTALLPAAPADDHAKGAA